MKRICIVWAHEISLQINFNTDLNTRHKQKTVIGCTVRTLQTGVLTLYMTLIYTSLYKWVITWPSNYFTRMMSFQLSANRWPYLTYDRLITLQFLLFHFFPWLLALIKHRNKMLTWVLKVQFPPCIMHLAEKWHILGTILLHQC